MAPKKHQPPPKHNEEEDYEEPPGCNIFCHMYTHPHLVSPSQPIVWVLGGPGVGKGTQCHRIVAKYGFTHLSTGDLLRAEVLSGSERGKFIKPIMEQGDLVPTDIVIDVVKVAIEKNPGAKGFLIDGYPREEHQGIAFEKTIAPCHGILYFEARPETLTKRLMGRAATSGRFDDNEPAIKERVKTFVEHNDEVLAQYRDSGKLARINAEREVNEIFSDVVKFMNPLVKA